MRQRVLDAIYKKLEEEPESENLQRQINLLSKSNICTIDSFCLDIVKNNFYELQDLSPNFRIADITEIELLKQETIEEIFEEKYEQESENFTKLINTYTSYKDDTPLKELVLKIYNYIQSTPFPRKWLNEHIEMLNLSNKLDEDFSNTIWGEVLLNDLEEELIDGIKTLEDIQKQLIVNTDLEKFEQTISNDISNLKLIKNNINSWDKVYELSRQKIFIDWPRQKIESILKDNAKEARDSVKTNINKKINEILTDDSKQNNIDIYNMYKMLKKLETLIYEFEDKFSKKKKEKNIVDFNDIEHFALKILLKEDENGNVTKTEIAKKYSEKFEEVAIDEYQDSNMVQEYILTSVSRNNNIFMVGDIKQSIYKFRHSTPKLFIDKYSEYKLLEDKLENDNLKIQLFKNFRSRKNILDITNLIFENIMSSILGDVEYTQTEFLNIGATDYKEITQNTKVELDIIDISNEESSKSEQTDSNKTIKNEYIENNYEDEDELEEIEHIENIELEAKYVANKIKELIESKFQIYDRKKEQFRDIKYKDIVILLRATKDKANIFEREIANLKMPVFSDTSKDYLEEMEIQTIISVLKIIDNPIQDIPLVAVLRSEIGGFSDNDLVEIRLADKYDNFYNCLLKAKLNVGEELKNKINNFLMLLENWQKEKEYLSLDELIWKIYTDTGYYNYVGLMQNGNIKQANLKMLFERAKQYEKSNFKGLYNFIKFIEKIKQSNQDLSPAKLIGENDDVIRIMSIHKSKGLEFPVVFLVNTAKQFNMQDIRKNPILLHQEMGIGAKYIDYELQIEYDTQNRKALKSKIQIENLSEEMRILYVALTRAKEKLFITAVKSDLAKVLENLNKQIKKYDKVGNKIHPILTKKQKSYLDWILLVYLYNKDNINDLLDFNILTKNNIFEFCQKEETRKRTNILDEFNNTKISKEDIERVSKEIELKYEYKLETMVPSKTSVSNLKQLRSGINNDIISFGIDSEEQNNDIIDTYRKNTSEDTLTMLEQPKFLKNEEDIILTSAQKGTLVHICMQYLDENVDYNISKIKDLIFSLRDKNIITKKEAENINPYKILKFTESEIFKSLRNAKEINKEKPFYINIPAKEIYNKEVDGKVLVQGVIDLYYIDENDNIILVDYKTDFVKTKEELTQKYSEQLRLYKMALEKATGKKVHKTYIYSVFLEEICEF